MSTNPDPYDPGPDRPDESSPYENYDQPAYAAGGPLHRGPGEAGSTKLAAGLCAILLPGLGIHKFILGYSGAGVIMLAVTVACATIGPCLFFAPWLGSLAMLAISFAEGIIYLTKSDEEFYHTYMAGRKEWF